MIENLLAAFYLSGAGSFEYAPDPKDGYGTAVHMEPRYSVGAGFSFDVARQVLSARDPEALERLMRGLDD